MISETDKILEILKGSEQVVSGYFQSQLEIVRKRIIENASCFLSELKSPITGKTYTLDGETISFSYERNISHRVLERRFDLSIDSDFYHKTIFFNSGISAIYNVIISLKRILRKEKLNILTQSSYFETGMINSILMNSISTLDSNTDVEFDVIFIESIDYNNLCYCSLIELIQSREISFSDNQITFIIVDTTLYKDKNEVENTFGKIFPTNVILIEVESLIKFYQLGLELSNVGAVTIYSHYSICEIVDDLAVYLKKVRNISGSNLNLYEIALLSNELMLNHDLVDVYRTRIYKNARKFYDILSKEKSNFKFIYPEKNKGESPFIIMKNESYTIDDYLLYCSLLKIIVEEEEVDVIMGSSFGFNHTRYELIITDRVKGEAFIKLSIGAFDENSQIEFASLINRLNSDSKIKQEFKRYGQIELLRLDDTD